MRQGEIVIGIILFIISLVVIIQSSAFTEAVTMAKTLSPAFYPRLLALCLMICSILLVLNALRVSTRIKPKISWGKWHSGLLFLALMLFQYFTFEKLGYFPSTFITLASMIYLLKLPLWKSVLVSACFLLFVYVFFVKIVGLRLPMEFLPMIFRSS